MPKLQCPHTGCNHVVKVGIDQAGHLVNCPDGHSFRVPQTVGSRPAKQTTPADPSSVSEVDDWAKLEQSGYALDQRVRLACSECGLEFPTRLSRQQTFVVCPECGDEVSVENRVRQSDSEKKVAARERVRQRKQSQRDSLLREERGWSVLGRGLGHIAFAASFFMGLQIWAAAAMGPLILPVIVASDASHPEDIARRLLFFHVITYIAEVVVMFGVVFHHDEIMGGLGNRQFGIALACGIGVYWMPLVFGNLTAFASLLMAGTLLIGTAVATIRALWGIVLCLAAPVRWHLRLFLLTAIVLAIASAASAFGLFTKFDFQQLQQPQNGVAPLDEKHLERSFLAIGICGNLAHLLFAEFVRQVMEIKEDRLSADFVRGYQVWFVVFVVASLLMGWIVQAELLLKIAIVFVVIGWFVADIALRNRFVIGLETARARCG